MSDPKDFLSRWSERKLTPVADKKSALVEEASLSNANKNAVAPSARVPEFDITALPSLESIGANSDIRAFLQRGVPASLTRAALRRAWSEDVAIRDFIGLSENAWDFNAPDSIPGFGSLNAEEVKRAAAQFFGQLTEEKSGEPTEEISERVAQEEMHETEETTSELKPPSDLDSKADPSPGADEQELNVAAQQENPVEQHATKRRHGSALPG
jgi:hypothetical protein